MTNQPEASREPARDDPDAGSSWLASALSGRRKATPAQESPGTAAADDGAAGPTTAGNPAVSTDPEPDHALSPLGAPPMPTTPTGAVRWWTAGATVAAAGLLSIAAYASVWMLAIACLLLVAVLAWAWPVLADLSSRRGSTAVIGLGGAGCVVAVALSEREPLLQWLALAVAGAVVLEFVHQLARRDGRPRLVECVAGTVAGIVVLASMSTWVALPRTDVAASGVLIASVPVAIGLALQALPMPGRLTGGAGIVLAALLAGVSAGFVPEPTVLAALVTGLVSTAVAVLLHRLLSVLPAAGSAPAWLAVALAPLAATGMVSYVALRLMVG